MIASFSAVAAQASPRATPTAKPDNRPSGIVPTTATLADVLARERRLRGPDVPNLVEEWTVQAYGLTGRDRDVYAGDDERHDSTLGPLVTASGRLKKQRWWQNENGLTVLEEGIHEKTDVSEDAIREAVRGSETQDVALLGEVVSPAPAYVVEVSPPQGRKLWLFFDKESGLVSRLEAVVENRRYVVRYDDLRQTDGHFSYWHFHSSDGRTENDVDYQRTSLSYPAAVAAADVAIPPNRRVLVEFPQRASPVQLPAKIVDGYVVVRVTIAGRGLDFILDSGASGIAIDSDIVRELNLPTLGAHSEETAGVYAASDVIVPEAKVGSLTMRDLHADNIPIQWQMTGETRVVGLLGFDFIADAIVHIDYVKGRVEAYDPDQMKPDRLKDAIVLDAYLDDGVPVVPVVVGNTPSHRFILDTGGGAIMVFSEFAKQHANDVRDMGAGARVPYLYRKFEGVGGEFDVVPTQLDRLSFAYTDFEDFLAFKMAREGTAFEGEDYDGLIGIPILEYYDVYFDYRDGEVVLLRNDYSKRAGRPGRPPRSPATPASTPAPAASPPLNGNSS